MARLALLVKGIVQGVGFRPFVYNLAKDLDLKGFVANSSHGVTIEVEGDRTSDFVDLLRRTHPPLASIHSIEITNLSPTGADGFVILESQDDGSFTHISPDVATCDDCLREMFDRRDRRYLYPFINCTNCGPRYTITKKVPYDRPNTTMSVFTMCPSCLAEYHDPGDRRFHAQPNACPVCGPRLEFRRGDGGGVHAGEGDPVGETIRLLKAGSIVAVKGLGGFHLCCDALNREAVERLREGKRRQNKPFALMAATIEGMERFCHVSPDEARFLGDPRRPIVLLRKRREDSLSESISPRNRYLGFMLPYAPVHHLLFHYPDESGNPDPANVPVGSGMSLSAAPGFDALVMTSGNLSEEPIVIDNDDALSRLHGIADAFLFHNRDIFMRVDDSVARLDTAGRTSFVRRSRGFVPGAVHIGGEGPDVLGCGADMKNTFTITKGAYGVTSQHIGDMENLETYAFFEETLDNLSQVYRARPVAVAHDLHPGYFSTRWAIAYAERNHLPRIALQHHFAHVASVMAEKGLRGPVIGVALDGTGYGTDGNLWGGEFLVCDLDGFERMGHFKYLPLPGGDGAIKECWRTAVSLLLQSAGEEGVWTLLDSVGFTAKYGRQKLETVIQLAGKKVFSPLSSGAGRLFDAVAALVGVCDRSTFEGEAAIALESILPRSQVGDPYPIDIKMTKPFVVDFSPMCRAIVNDIVRGDEKAAISGRFHRTIVDVIVEGAARIREETRVADVALSGGVFQNASISEASAGALAADGFTVHVHEQLPPNDACISLGQAYVVRHRSA